MKYNQTLWLTSFSVHASSDNPSFNGTEGPLIIKYAVVLTTSVQNCLGKPACNHILLACSTIVLFIRSVTPFCCSVCGTIFSLLILFKAQNFSNSLLQYFSQLLNLKHLSLNFVSFSTKVLHLLNTSNTSNLCFMK